MTTAARPHERAVVAQLTAAIALATASAIVFGCGAPRASPLRSSPEAPIPHALPPPPPDAGASEPDLAAPPVAFKPVSLSCSEQQCCAIGSDGSVRCWNMTGSGGPERERNPAPVPGMPPAGARPVRVAVGGRYACATMTDGRAWCWGDNTYGELGDATVVARATPVPVPGLEGVRQVYAREHSACALLATDGVWCWGGAPSEGSRRPALITTLARVAQIAVGDDRCARFDDGSVRCSSFSLTEIHGERSLRARDALDLSLSDDHGCVLHRDGGVSCWGLNHQCQVGGTVPAQRVPAPFRVPGVHGAVSVSVSSFDSFALRADGSLLHWGGGSYPEQRCRTRVVPTTAPLQQAVAAGHAVCGLDRESNVTCYGFSWNGPGDENVRVNAILFL